MVHPQKININLTPEEFQTPDIFILDAKELGLERYEWIVFEDSSSGVKAAISAGAPIVVAVMEKCQRNTLEGLVYDKNKTKLISLDSMDQFDFSLLKSLNN